MKPILSPTFGPAGKTGCGLDGSETGGGGSAVWTSGAGGTASGLTVTISGGAGSSTAVAAAISAGSAFAGSSCGGGALKTIIGSLGTDVAGVEEGAGFGARR